MIRLAAEGEEILITVRGEPMAKLTGVAYSRKGSDDIAGWIDELTDSAAREVAGIQASTPQSYWDETRADR